MKKKVLFLAYHHPSNKNSQSTALVRRIEQYQSVFETLGWEIDYIVTENKEQAIDKSSRQRVLEVPIQDYIPNKFLNKIFTLSILVRYGDIIGYSFHKHRNQINNFLQSDYSIIISFFTPRGTIWLGSEIRKISNATWWVDIQDSLDEGLIGISKIVGIKWLKNKLQLADQLIHVSPEWANLDGDRVAKQIHSNRHVIPEFDSELINSESNIENLDEHVTNVFYAGNIHFDAMQPSLMVESFTNTKNVRLIYAGANHINEKLQNLNLNPKMLGYLDKNQLYNAYNDSDILLVLAWAKQGRLVIPSKFYEACAFKKPILIVGKDSGAFKFLFEEWGHPNVLCDTQEKITEAIDAFQKGDVSKMFVLDNCINEVSTLKNFHGFLENLIQETSC